ncbi:iron-containing alcohol dehydrogenase-like protein [Bradyrhizobium stylosanthis]|uniref:Iron-containing alcohol dehydrogenase-like protein n=1 Tax=Bradyrhizobium stylosanthis TaxID=1803665 RepID=A0A560DZ54_9BRAD|nr:iron-containing alcohol dehydrogenase-like protein [Bradyrhizobium stylosanthis]
MACEIPPTGEETRIADRRQSALHSHHLTLPLPVGLTVTSGINAIAHAVEALYAHDTNPVASLMAEEGIFALAPRAGDGH